MSAQIHSPSRRLAQTWSTASPRPAHSARRGSRGSPRRRHGREARPLAIRSGGSVSATTAMLAARPAPPRRRPPPASWSPRAASSRSREARDATSRSSRSGSRSTSRARGSHLTPSDRPVATQPAVPRPPRQQAQPPRSHLTKDEVPPRTTRRRSSTHRAFGAVVGNCPFAHVGGATLANTALRAQPVKAPLYHAFKAFAGEGIFTAEGRDWVDKRAEVLAAFAAAGLEPLADASARVARRLTREIDVHLGTSFDSNSDPNVGRGGVVEMLPRLQRATLRATFAYLVGRSIDDAVAAHGAERGAEGVSTTVPTRVPTTCRRGTVGGRVPRGGDGLRHRFPRAGACGW